ncbi:hypothetical protein HMP0721_1342 [Pseudoramibacter alactolyticus ATCC 23263]|uniref:Uncharacterized protein n=1 Tax=Pseudoramibacter alactolyticus ATCC 23263 TaxID=887929 RepID=E6MH57_9FIRM|nr:hypothetical protein HMP0721_1342 [Pseudoramibacter alactolyticus ATCC 23263]
MDVPGARHADLINFTEKPKVMPAHPWPAFDRTSSARQALRIFDFLMKDRTKIET